MGDKAESHSVADSTDVFVGTRLSCETLCLKTDLGDGDFGGGCIVKAEACSSVSSSGSGSTSASLSQPVASFPNNHNRRH